MTDKVLLGLRGSIRSVTTTRQTGNVLHTEEQLFDPDGILVRHSYRDPEGVEQLWIAPFFPQTPIRRILNNADGSRMWVDDISRLDTWSMEALHSISFGTKGASSARTSFDSGGVPLETLIEGEHGVYSRIQYVCDSKGNIMEAIQYSGPSLPLLVQSWVDQATPSALEAARPLAEPGIEQFRAAFRYDDVGRLVEKVTYFAGQVLYRTVMTYNDFGDVMTMTCDDQPPARYEYEYDDRQNWVRKTITYTTGEQTRYLRKITYYE
jgi:hypothetical protein